MSPLTEFDQHLEKVIREFALRIVVPRWTEFDSVWEAAMRVCDRYELGKSRRTSAEADQPSIVTPQGSTSSAEPSATDAPAQTRPPVAA